MDSFSQLCSDFTKLSPVEAIALGGSRSGTNHDHSSDYDLYIYCSSIPPIEDRQNIIERHCRYFEINNQYWETEDDCTLNNGIDIDILYRSMKDFENGVANVVERFIAGNGYTTCFWHNLMSSKILFDPQNKLKKLQERFDVPYPEMLKKNIISRNFNLLTGKLPSYDRQIIKAVTRQDFVSVNHRVSAFLESYFDIIFALNELTHPGEKRMISYAKEQANILPKDFETNILKLCSINSQN
uniref:DUF4037 domain-containing protein n=1 Tax=Streptococcus merionis TaxID=400065 RepID=UPI0026EF3CFC